MNINDTIVKFNGKSADQKYFTESLNVVKG